MFRRKSISETFIAEFIKLSAGRILPKVLDEYISLIEKEIHNHCFTETSENNLLRIIRSQYDFTLFINDSIKYPYHIEILISIVSNSNYLSDIIVMSPEYFSWVVNPSTLKTKLNLKEFKKELQLRMQNQKSFDAKVNTLKNIKRKEILRIGLKDIYDKEKLKYTTEELSILAIALTSTLFSVCYETVLKKYSTEKINRKYCLIALGKLGGMELNYSSDIDLMLFYDKNQKLRTGKYYSEILIEAANLFIQSSTDIKGGFLYRIDFRLRPDGKFSQLSRSFNEYLNYYESRGEDWERQMLIKTGFVSGSLTLYQKFTDYLSAFVYPSTFSISPQKQIVKMKESIERQLKDETNIKLTFGGIRDIEFSVQALQLVNGGKNKKIRTGNTLNGINKLEKAKLLTKSEEKTFSNAYIFFRQIEHYLQLMNNRQTHEIPEVGEILEKLAFYFNYNNSNEFKDAVSKSREEVRRIYNSILSGEESSGGSFIDLNQIVFEDTNKANSDLLYLREGKGIIGTRTFDIQSIQSFLKIEKKLFEYLKSAVFPDRVLSNFVRLIRQANFPSIWYQELLDEQFFRYIMKISEFSQYSIDLLAEDKDLREITLSRKVFLKIPVNELAGHKLKFNLYYLSVQVITGLLKPVDASALLSRLIQMKIKDFVETNTTKSSWNKDYFIAVLGSLGSSVITFYSDIDILFIVKNLVKYPNIEKEVQEILAGLRDLLKPFTIDCRLRPEGKSSQLVWDVKDAGLYFQKRARVWEFQTLTKISFVSGNKRLFNDFIKNTSQAIGKFKKNEIKKEMIDMHKRITSQRISVSPDLIDIKKGNGGLTDIEFIVLYSILVKQELYTKSFGNSFIEQLKFIKEAGFKISDLKILMDTFEYSKSIQIFNQLIFISSSSKILFDEKRLKAFSAVMKYKNIDKFRGEIKSNILNTKKIFMKVFT